MKPGRIITGLALFAGLAMIPPGGTAGVLAANAGSMLATALGGPLSIFADRSPGSRGLGAMFQSKPHLPAGPSERVLSPVLDRPAQAIPVDLENLPNRVMDVVEPGPAVALPGDPGGAPLPPLPGAAGGPIPPGGSGGSGGGGGGGGGGGQLPSPPPPSPPIVSAVPEPSTWLMMIAGIALAGLQLRRQQRRLRSGCVGAAGSALPQS